ncbi:MAG: hypothetical protein ABIQ95_05415 [Bdellovibrionia bacterium]
MGLFLSIGLSSPHSGWAAQKIGIECKFAGLALPQKTTIILKKSYPAQFKLSENVFVVDSSYKSELLSECMSQLIGLDHGKFHDIYLLGLIGPYGRAIPVEFVESNPALGGDRADKSDTCNACHLQNSIIDGYLFASNAEYYLEKSELEKKLKLLKKSQKKLESKINQKILRIHAVEQAGAMCEHLPEDQFKLFKLESKLFKIRQKVELHKIHDVLKDAIRLDQDLDQMREKFKAIILEQDDYKAQIEKNINNGEEVIFEFLEELERDSAEKLKEVEALIPTVLQVKMNLALKEEEVPEANAADPILPSDSKSDKDKSTSPEVRAINAEIIDICESIQNQEEKIGKIYHAYKMVIKSLNWNIKELSDVTSGISVIQKMIDILKAEIIDIAPIQMLIDEFNKKNFNRSGD